MIIDPKNDLCELAFTGGATGVPKGVMVTHANRYSCLRQGLPWLMEPMLRGLAGKSSVLVAIPLFHTYGHYVYQSSTYLGLRVILLPDPRDTTLLAKTIKEFRPLLIAGVPTQFMRVSQEPLPRMNSMLLSGSAPLPVEVSKAIRQKTGMPVTEGYGLTETSTVATINVSAFSKITGFMPELKTGIGIPTPDTECRLVDPDTAEEVPFGQPGEIVVRGPQIMKGYWPQPGAGLTADGWLHTGDIAVMADDELIQDFEPLLRAELREVAFAGVVAMGTVVVTTVGDSQVHAVGGRGSCAERHERVEVEFMHWAGAIGAEEFRKLNVERLKVFG